MPPWRRLAPVLVLGVLFVAYVVARPALAEGVPHLGIAEYPLGLLVAGTLVYVALRRPRAEREPEPPVWRRHEQVVRAVPDPEVARLDAPLRAWLDAGERPEEAARVLALSQARDAKAAEALVPALAERLSSAKSPKSRRKLMDDLSKPPGA